MRNRSVPVDTVLPHLMYPDVPAAIDLLARHFGFAEHYRYGDPVSGAQVLLGRAVVMLKAGTPAPQSLTIFVDDVRSHYERAKAAGARITEELHETCYGELQYGVTDFAGHQWLFSEHARDLSPADWGATLA
jgi:uncharacterized glyoxalase superfamily protein PhnB